MTTITLQDIADLRQSLADENISYGECHLIECLADEFGLVTDWGVEDGDPMPYEVVLDEVEARLK